MASGTYRVAQTVRPADPRLGRHVNHDPRSRRFPVRTADVKLRSVRHTRHVPIFDQGNLGSCTGNAAVGCMATDPFHTTLDAHELELIPLDQSGAVNVYAHATMIDPFPGSYPPEDTGSDGLSVAKVLHANGLIAGYEWAFTLDTALQALMERPFITGTWWTEDMFEPDAEGIVHPTGRDAGGHEYVCDGYDAERGLVWFANSWGEGFGEDGRFAIPAEEYGDLLDRQGDVTFFVASDAPAPEPVDPDMSPSDAADLALAAAVGPWARRDAVASRPKRRAIRAWLDAKGL